MKNKRCCGNCKWFEGSLPLYNFPVILCKKMGKEAKLLKPMKRPFWENYYCGEFSPKKPKVKPN